MATRRVSSVRHPNMVHLFVLTCRLLALVYNGINSTIDHMREKHDALGSMIAGGITGALYKSTGMNSDVSYFHDHLSHC